MISFMEKQGKYSITTFESFKNALKGSYGDMSLRWNAALAMFLTADPDEQEAWIQRLIAAKRTAGGQTTLERVRALAKQSAPPKQTGPDAAYKAAAEHLNRLADEEEKNLRRKKRSGG